MIYRLVQLGLVRPVVDPKRPGQVMLDMGILDQLIAEYGPRVTTAAGDRGASPAEIWTPDSARGGAAIWTPGSDAAPRRGTGTVPPHPPGAVSRADSRIAGADHSRSRAEIPDLGPKWHWCTRAGITLRAGRPLAAWASWQRALRLGPGPVGGRAGDRDAGIRRRPARGGAVRLPAPPAQGTGPPRSLERSAAGPGRRSVRSRISRRWPTRSAGWRRRNLRPGRLVQPGALPGLAGVQSRGGRLPGPRGRAGGRSGARPRGRSLDPGRAPPAGGRGRGPGRRPAVRLHRSTGTRRDAPQLLDEFPEVQRVPTPQVPGVESGHGSGGRGLRVAGSEATCPAAIEAGDLAAAGALPVVLASVISPVGADATALQPSGRDAPPGRGSAVPPARGLGRGSIRRARRRRCPLPFLDADVWTVRVPRGLEPSHADGLPARVGRALL